MATLKTIRQRWNGIGWDIIQDSQFDNYLPLVGGVLTGNLDLRSGVSNTARILLDISNAGSPQIGLSDYNDDNFWAIGADDADNNFKIHGQAGSIPTINNLVTPLFEIQMGGDVLFTGHKIGDNTGKLYYQDTDIHSIFLGLTETAADSDKLDGYDYNHFQELSETFVNNSSPTKSALGIFPSTAKTMIGNEYNILLNGYLDNRLTYTVTGNEDCGFTQSQLKALTDGQIAPQYSPDGINPSNPLVLLIEGLPVTHTQTGGVVGWTSRYWYPSKYKIELYNEYGGANTWVTFIDQSATSNPTQNIAIPVPSIAGGGYTKIRITIYESVGSAGANGYPRVGLSELFFHHPEAARVYEYANVTFLNGYKDTDFAKLSGATFTGNLYFSGGAGLVDAIIKNSAIGTVPLTVNAITGTTAYLQEWKVNNSNVAWINGSGIGYFNSDIYTTSILNKSTGNNSAVYVNNTGTVISRNIADANPALIVNLANASSTGYIQAWQFDGTNKAYMSLDGVLYASKFSDFNNSTYYLDPASTGTSLNVAGDIVAQGKAFITGYINVKYKAIGSYAEIVSGGNEMVLDFAGSATGYINYRLGDSGSALTMLVWNAGSSTTWLNQKMGDVYAGTLYNRDNTVYYLDLDNTGTALNVAGGIKVAGPENYSKVAIRNTNDTAWSIIDNNKHYPLRLEDNGSGLHSLVHFRVMGTTADVFLGALGESGMANRADFVIKQDNDGVFLETFRIKYDGRVGIGTDSPTAKLNIVASAAPVLSGATPTNVALKISNNDNAYGMLFGTLANGNGIIQQRRTDSETYYSLLLNPYGGNVGIGTTTASQKLTVNGDISATVYYDYSDGTYYLDPANTGTALNVAGNIQIPGGKTIQLYGTTGYYLSYNTWYTSTGEMRLQNANAAGIMTFFTNNTEKVRIDAAGQVGIGTTPTTIFAVLPTATVESYVTAANGTIGFANNAAGAQAPILFARSTDTNKSALQLIALSHNTNSANDMAFNIRENDNTDFATISGAGFVWTRYGTEIMRLTRDGKLGIGVSDPDESLEVKGAIQVTGNGTDGGIIYFRSDRNDTRIYESNYILYVEAPSGLDFDFDSNGNGTGAFNINENNVTRFYIAPGGDTGIGTNAPHAKLEVVGTVRVTRDGTATGQEGIYLTTAGLDGNADMTLAFWENDSYLYGARWFYAGNSTNDFSLFIHDNSAGGREVIKIARAGGITIGDITTHSNDVTLYDASATSPELKFQNATYTAGIDLYNNTKVLRFIDRTGNASRIEFDLTVGSAWLGGGLTVTSDIYVGTSTTKLSKGTANSLRVTTNSGWVELGPQNTNWMHFLTDRGNFYFNKGAAINGDIMPYAFQTTKLNNTNGYIYELGNRVYSAGNNNIGTGATNYAAGNHTQAVTAGGTGLTSFAAGDIIYASAANTLSALAKGTDGKILKLVSGLPSWQTEYSYTLPLAANGTRGGIQIGFSESGNDFAVKLSSEKAYVTVPVSGYLPLGGGALTGTLTINQTGESGNIVYSQSGGCYIPRPLGGQYVTTTDLHTGGVAISLPTASWNQSDMISFWVDIFDYAGDPAGETVSVFVYGYQYSTGNWTNVGALVLSDRTDKDYTVRFGNDGTRHIVYIGETNSTWDYPQVIVRDFQAGYSANYANYTSAFAISFETTFLNVQKTASSNYVVAKSAAVWSTARTLTIGATGKSVDGSGNVSWSLAEIGAQAAGTYDNYVSWSFAVDGVTKDAITSGDILNFKAGSNVAITRSADDEITFSATNTTYSAATASVLGLIKLNQVAADATINTASTSVGRFYPINLTTGGIAYVNIPWTDTTYSAANASELGLIKIGYTESGNNFAVKLSSEKAYVTVPISSYLPLAGGTLTGPVSSNSNITTSAAMGGGTYLYTSTADSKTKIRLYGTSDVFAIGMETAHTFGGLNDWAMTFQFNNEADRGFWWGDTAHTKAQGAMALTTDGKLTVAHSIRVGYGEADTTAPGATYVLDVYGNAKVDGTLYEGSYRVYSDGNKPTALDVLTVSNTGATGSIPLVVNGITGTSVNLQEWRVNGTPLAYITKEGYVKGAQVYDNNNRVYSSGNNNIGTGATNYAAGNHKHKTTLALDDIYDTTSNSMADLGNFSIAVGAGKTYKVTVVVLVTTAAVTTGWSLGLRLSAGSGTMLGELTGRTSQSMSTYLGYPLNSISTSYVSRSYGTFTAGPGTTSVGTCFINAIVKSNSAANLIVGFASEVSGSSITIGSGYFIIEEL